MILATFQFALGIVFFVLVCMFLQKGYKFAQIFLNITIAIVFYAKIAEYIDGYSIFGSYTNSINNIFMPIFIIVFLYAMKVIYKARRVLIKLNFIKVLIALILMFVIVFYTAFCEHLSFVLLLILLLDFFVILGFINAITNRIPNFGIEKIEKLNAANITVGQYFCITLFMLAIIILYGKSFSILCLKDSNSVITCDISDTLYFSIVTWTTVGYGDLVPRSNIGRVFAASEALTGYVMMTLMITALISTVQLSYSKYDKK